MKILQGWIDRFMAYWTSAENIRQHTRADVVVLDAWTDQLIGCCDCGLMHRFDFGMTGHGQLTMRGRRDDVATTATRRDKGPFVCQPVVRGAVIAELRAMAAREPDEQIAWALREAADAWRMKEYPIKVVYPPINA